MSTQSRGFKVAFTWLFIEIQGRTAVWTCWSNSSDSTESTMFPEIARPTSVPDSLALVSRFQSVITRVLTRLSTWPLEVECIRCHASTNKNGIQSKYTYWHIITGTYNHRWFTVQSAELPINTWLSWKLSTVSAELSTRGVDRGKTNIKSGSWSASWPWS